MKLNYKSILVAISLACAGIVNCKANLGDTIAQSVERYGTPTNPQDKYGRVFWYYPEGISVKAYFTNEGICDAIVYYKEQVNNISSCFTPDEFSTFVSVNMVGKVFTSVPTGYGFKWVSTDNEMVAYSSVISANEKTLWSLKIATADGDKRAEEVVKALHRDEQNAQKNLTTPTHQVKGQRI